MKPQELDDLLDRYLHGVLNESETARVHRLVSQDSQAADRLAHLSVVRCMLVRMGQREQLSTDLQGENSLLEVGNTILSSGAQGGGDSERTAAIQARAERQLQVFLHEQEALRQQASMQNKSHRQLDVRQIQRRAQRFLTWTYRSTVACAAALILSVALYGVICHMYRPRVVASLSKTVDAAWAAPRAESILYPGPLTLEQGYAQLTFKTGARVILEAPCHVTLKSAQTLMLHSGRLTSTVPKTALGFTVVTPHSRVVDYGTEFGVDVDRRRGTEAAVFTGEVRVASAQKRRQGTATALLKGQAVQTNAAGVVGTVWTLDHHHSYRRSWDDVLYLPVVTGACQMLRALPSQWDTRLWPGSSAIVFLERRSVTLEQDLAPLVTDVGPVDDLVSPPGRLGAGQVVDSYLIHYKPNIDLARTGDQSCFFQIRFPRPILGMVVNDELLSATDASLGHPQLLYPQDALGRGLEPVVGTTNATDEIFISDDRMTLTCTLFALFKGDQMRVLVSAVPVSDPNE